MPQLSAVIITHNEQENISGCIASARQVTDDIIVVDSGSRDETVSRARQSGARVFIIEWKGYGHSRNFGASKARNSWILSLDADERISSQLASSINNLVISSPGRVIQFRRRNYLGRQPIRFGAWGYDKVTRIYHRAHGSWDLSAVHEKLVSDHLQKTTISGHIDHYGFKDHQQYIEKVKLYARLSAVKYLEEDRKAGLIKRWGSPLFNGMKSYLLQLGFLDGRNGFRLASTIAYYSWLKYHYLRQLRKENHVKELKAPVPAKTDLSNQLS